MIYGEHAQRGMQICSMFRLGANDNGVL